MTYPRNTLKLLSPWALKAQIALPKPQQSSAHQVLELVLKVLEDNSEDAQNYLQQAQKILPKTTTQTLQLNTTDTPLSPEEVASYDDYFGIQHVSSDEPGLNQIQGLLDMLEVFLSLSASIQQKNKHHIQQQKQGLKQHALLLARVFDLELSAS